MKRNGKKIKNFIVFILFFSLTTYEFAIADDTYTLNVSVYPVGGGSVTKSPDKTSYSYGENVTLTAVPNMGYNFRNWSGDISSLSPNPTTIAIYHNMSVVANFKAIFDDKTPPTISGYIPEVDSIQVPRDTIIQVRITDDIKEGTSGLALESVNITVEGVLIYDGATALPDGSFISPMGICRRVQITASSDYLYVFQPSDLFDYEQQVDVVVSAKDLNSNSVEKSYYFYTVMRSFGRNIKVNSDTGAYVQNNPATARDSDGNIWVVWDQTTEAGDTDIYIGKRLSNGSVFKTSVPVVKAPFDQRKAAIAIDGNDKLYVVWEEDKGTSWDILLLTSTDGTNWTYDSGSEPFQVNINDPDPKAPDPMTRNPAIAINRSTNDIYITWEEKRDNKDIWVRSFEAGTWGDATKITKDLKSQSEPAIAIGENGTAYIIWSDERNLDTDIYGADSAGTWLNVKKIVSTPPYNQSGPTIAPESSGSVLHLLWIDNTDPDGTIFYGATTDGLEELLEVDIELVDEPDYAQSAPAIAVHGSGENVKVFACWKDGRWIDSGDPADIYFAESGSDFGTNILVNDDVGENVQSAPAIGIDDGNPYMVWVDDRLGNNDIYAAVTTETGTALAEIEVSAANGGTIEITGTNGIVDDEGDVIVEIPAGALPADTKIKIAELINPPSLPPGGFGIPYEFGPSGLVFNEPVKITIPHSAADCPAHPTYLVFWYNTQTGDWSPDGGIPANHVEISPMLHAVVFETTHFTTYSTGGGVPVVAGGGGGGGGGGGCAVSPNGQGNVIEYMLPYVFYVIVLLIIKRKDANCRRIV